MSHYSSRPDYKVKVEEWEPVFEYICFACGLRFGRAHAMGNHVATAHRDRDTEKFRESIMRDVAHEKTVLDAYERRMAGEQSGHKPCD
jgi:hypothetical protein